MGVVVFMGAGRCKSADLRRETIQQQAENAEVVEIVKRIVPPGAEQTRIVNALEHSSAIIEKNDEARTVAETHAAENADAAHKWHLVLWGLGAAAAVAGGYAVKRFLL